LEGQIYPTLNKDVSGLKLSNCIGQDSGNLFNIAVKQGLIVPASL